MGHFWRLGVLLLSAQNGLLAGPATSHADSTVRPEKQPDRYSYNYDDQGPRLNRVLMLSFSGELRRSSEERPSALYRPLARAWAAELVPSAFVAHRS